MLLIPNSSKISEKCNGSQLMTISIIIGLLLPYATNPMNILQMDDILQ